MSIVRFIYKTLSFRKIIFCTIIFIIITGISSLFYDILWGQKTSLPILNLNDVYKPPVAYDNITRINLKLVSTDRLAIEGNKKFKLLGSNKNYDYYDTLKIEYPPGEFEYTNKYFLNFEFSKDTDSIYLVVSRSNAPDIFYKQIFYSSVTIQLLNKFSDDPNSFRIFSEDLVDKFLLDNNDSLINQTINFYNNSLDTFKFRDCGSKSLHFKKIADLNNLPCRIITLQGGDDEQTGYYNSVGYPLHVVCEIYSSKLNKWYVIDPTYGFRFKSKNSDIYLNAVEICNHYVFKADHDIVMDPIIEVGRSFPGRDYYKFYENIYYVSDFDNRLIKKLINIFYSNLNYEIYHYSNIYPPIRNGFYYIGFKSFMYFLIIIFYLNSILIIIAKRLFIAKKPSG